MNTNSDIETIRSELASLMPRQSGVENLDADDEFAAVLHVDSLVFLQFLAKLENRYKVDLMQDFEALQGVKTLRDVHRLVASKSARP